MEACGEPLEISDDEDPAPPPAPPAPVALAPAPAGGDPEDPEDDDDEEDNQDDGPPAQREKYCVYTSFNEEGYFPMLLQDVLGELNNIVAPMY